MVTPDARSASARFGVIIACNEGEIGEGGSGEHGERGVDGTAMRIYGRISFGGGSPEIPYGAFYGVAEQGFVSLEAGVLIGTVGGGFGLTDGKGLSEGIVVRPVNRFNLDRL